MTSAHPPTRDEAAEELDRLRLENQHLRVRLADAASLRRVLAGGARTAVAGVRRRAYGVLRAHTDHDSKRAPATAPPPYVVRRLHAPMAVRPRVLHVLANFHIGGSPRLVIDIVEHLDHRYEQSVVSWDLPRVPAYAGITVRHHAAKSAEAAVRVLRAQRPDLLHIHYLGHHGDKYGARDWEWYRHWFAAAERVGVPVIENINIPTEPYVSDAVACYVYVSDYVRSKFGRRDGRHVTIYPGSDLDMFQRAIVPAPADDCLGMVYRLDGDKVNERAIEPFIDSIRLRPGTRALIVGGGSLLDHYRRRVVEAGMEDAFTFTGYVAYDALPALYQEMSIFVAPVHWESFGQVTSFAMGMQLPVVGYDVGAIPEIVNDATLLAPSGDSSQLGAIAAALLDDRARRVMIGDANRARAERLFSVKAMVAAYESLYDELVTDQRTHGTL